MIKKYSQLTKELSPEEIQPSTKDILQHIENNNPHSGARDAFQGIGRDFFKLNWKPLQYISPEDPRINKDSLFPASNKDVLKYICKYKQGSEFPAIVLKENNSSTFSILDGAHRLKAAIILNKPILAYIGY